MEIYIVKYFFTAGDHLTLGAYTDREDARNCVKHYVKADGETIAKTIEGLYFDWYELDDDTYYEISSVTLDETFYDENGDEVKEEEEEEDDDDFCPGRCDDCPNVEKCFEAEDDPEDEDEDEDEENIDFSTCPWPADCDTCPYPNCPVGGYEEKDEEDEDDDEDDFLTYLRNLFASILE